MASSKKSGSGEPDTTGLFHDLVKFQGNGEFDKALKTCNKILNVRPKDASAFHCKMVCLIQTDKFEACLQQMDEHEAMAAALVFERAYALYRLNRSAPALAILNQKKTLNLREKELKAQVLYRMEEFEASFNLYRDIMKNTSADDDDFETERLTNLSAAAVQLDKDSGITDLDTYELIYNQACHLLAQGKWLEAEKGLSQALKAAQAFLAEEDDSEEDIERETGIIRVQMGYALQMQGRDKEAQVLYNQVLKNKPSDAGLIAVASNNLLSLNKDQNIFDSKKRIKAAKADGVEQKLTKANQFAIARNNALLAMYTNQVDLCRELIEELARKFDLDPQDRQFILAGALSRAGQTKEAVDLLLSDKGAKSDLERVLVACQIYLERSQVREAVDLLNQLPKADKYRTGILSTMVTLYLALEDRKSAAQLLKEAVAFNSKSKNKGDMAVVWRKTAEFHLKGDEPSVAAQSLEELLKTNPQDRQTLAQLVMAYAKFDLEKALATSKKLPEFREVDVDVDGLENSAFFGPKHSKKTPKAGGVASPDASKNPPGSDLVKKKKPKKKRKTKLPKNYDPTVEPDPERWLPKRERTGHRRPKRDRRKGEKFTGAQGTAAGQSETYDYSQKKAGAVPKGNLKSPAPEAPVGPRQAHKKPQQKKKQKKRF
ncbi:hypothetical protein TCAL_06202 [Tigriopus californicus]|uniref:Signal recognition particle subunit SRP72 n=1 Tax=Tigriopus californicus TaxID=6832 RepID=A0A553NTG0_TIGCA|nr:signal recognition particle subunit SRP72-like [Tigriopus californicus]TRY68710.1 hypothetical protein TCAL_06202 [Tigriopus californicus]|eukprot:TCALIF_06202-PA protein Name:"Similar to SRP72 Signal recognition particle subunit SRP72 (Canis familiaris)" AED:0.00 eAED:0.00 QI:145/1/1/1/1/1/2/61/657